MPSNATSINKISGVPVQSFFGTDGIRGLANKAPMDAETALKIGMAAGAYFTQGAHRHRVIIGKDTRLSGYMIESALVAGFLSMGMDVFLVGPLPTPAVAMITRSMRADVGVMISASHNPYYDNGIKLFQPNGLKLSDEAELAIESLMSQNLEKYKAEPDRLGRAKRIEDAIGRYIEFVKKSFPKRQNLSKFKIVLDCANGAAYKIAPIIFWELGAEVITIANSPNGFNINDNCGSTATAALKEAVLQHKADIGIALDGDADRLIICDEKGNTVEGDQIISAVALNWAKNNRLNNNTVVTTIMSNMAMDDKLAESGISVVRTKVGDRHVSEEMREKGFNIGGESSGHIIFNDYITTGDGILAALQVLAYLENEQKPASEALKIFEPWPQYKDNIKFRSKLKASEIATSDAFKKLIATEEAQLKATTSGRILIRPSGTEPLLRILVEAKNEQLTKEIGRKISEYVMKKVRGCE